MTDPPESFGAGRYRVDGVIGEGGMGTVYAVTVVATGQRAALKTVRASLAKERDARERLEREARAIFLLDHPHVVRGLDFGAEPDGRAWIVMEWLEGVNLRDLINAQGPLATGRAARLGAQVADALAAAHAIGVLHRDVKPTNVMVVRGYDGREVAKLLDFGIASLKQTPTYDRLTKTGEILGTPSFMAPEQVGSSHKDPRSDVYGLGATLYAALSGRAPYGGGSLAELIAALLRGDRPPLAVLRPDAGPLGSIVERAMAAQPDERFATASELKDALTRHASEGAVAPTTDRGPAPATTPPNAGSRRSRRWLVYATLIPLALALGVALPLVLVDYVSEPDPDPGSRVDGERDALDAGPAEAPSEPLATDDAGGWTPRPLMRPDAGPHASPRPRAPRARRDAGVGRTRPPSDAPSSRDTRGSRLVVTARASSGDRAIPNRLARLRQSSFLRCWERAGGGGQRVRLRLSYAPGLSSTSYPDGVEAERGACVRQLFAAHPRVSGSFEGDVTVQVRSG